MPVFTSSTAPETLLPLMAPVRGSAPRRRRFAALRAAWRWVMAPIEHEPGALRRIARARSGMGR